MSTIAIDIPYEISTVYDLLTESDLSEISNTQKEIRERDFRTEQFPWLRPPINLSEAKNLILRFKNVAIHRIGDPPRSIKWPLRFRQPLPTALDIGPSFNLLTEQTIEFVLSRNMQDSLIWLQTAAPRYFLGANFEADLLPSEDGEENLLALRVYGSFDADEFRKRRHQICRAMLESGHKTLYKTISIFQRRVHDNGRQALSWYSTVSEE